METSSLIEAYAQQVAGELAFDRKLAARVRDEITDHLREAAASLPGDPVQAQQHAIARFGDPGLLASQFAAAGLERHRRRMTVALACTVAVVFLAMKARLAWYLATQWAMPGDRVPLAQTVAMVAQGAFWIAVLLGAAAWACLGSVPPEAGLHDIGRIRLKRFLGLAMAAVAALEVVVAADTVLTALRFAGTPLSLAHAVPLLALAAELAYAVALACRLPQLARSTRHARGDTSS